MCWHHLALLLQIFLFVSGEKDVKDIYILGLFPMKGEYAVGQTVKPAIELTLDYVNKNPNILPGYRLNLKWSESMCDPGYGVKAFVEMMCNETTFIMIIGPACSSVSEVTADAANLVNLVQVSYGSTSFTLSDNRKFPFFFRSVASEKMMNFARVALVKHFNWTKVVTIHQIGQFFTPMMEHMEDLLQEENIALLKMYVYFDNPRKVIHNMQKDDTRIIIGGFFEEDARILFCEAFKIGFYGPKIVWVMLAFFIEDWWQVNDTDCTSDQILLAVGDYLSIEQAVVKDENIRDDNGYTHKQFMQDFSEKMNNPNYKELPGYHLVPSSYDAVWVIAHSLNISLGDLKNSGYGLDRFSYNNMFMGQLFKKNMLKVKFLSITGQVSFFENGDMRKLLSFHQFIDKHAVTFGTFDHIDDHNIVTWNMSVTVKWPNGIVPKDSAKICYNSVLVSAPLYIIMCVFSAVGILLSLAFLALSIKYRKTRIIKLSSAVINDHILLGSIMTYTYVFVNGVDISEVPVICEVKAFLLVIGCSLVFGSLFVKMWHVYFIFIASKKTKKQVPKDSQFLIKLAMFVAINLIIMIVWASIDPLYPMQKMMHDKKVYHDDSDVISIPVLWNCSSTYHTTFYIMIMCSQITVLLLSIFLAYTTRKAVISVLNDSKAVSMCIYNVITLAVLGLPATMMLKNNVDGTYGLISFLVITGTTSTQCLIFVPKMIQLKRYLNGDETQSRFIVNPLRLNASVQMASIASEKSYDFKSLPTVD